MAAPPRQLRAHRLHRSSMRLKFPSNLRANSSEKNDFLATENGREANIAHLRMYTQPTQLFATGEQLLAHSEPTLRPPCDLARCPLLGALFMHLESNF